MSFTGQFSQQALSCVSNYPSPWIITLKSNLKELKPPETTSEENFKSNEIVEIRKQEYLKSLSTPKFSKKSHSHPLIFSNTRAQEANATTNSLAFQQNKLNG